MRESNFSFPVQNRAAVVITSQLYDRRALDSSSPLPLFNSLTHLTYLTSTSPRIREILTIDGGLERLVRLLRDFCSWPPPPQSPRAIYGLKPPAPRPPKRDSSVERNLKGKGKLSSEDQSQQSALESADDPSSSSALSATNPPQFDPNATSPLHCFDRAAAFRFSLAFQCVVNIGVRGSESVRARVVQAGMLDVVSAVLECWLVSKGFAVCPSPTGSGMPRESKEVRNARRLEMLERRQRETAAAQATQAAELARALSGISSAPVPRSITVSSNSQVSTSTPSSADPTPSNLNDDMMLMFMDSSGATTNDSRRPSQPRSSSDHPSSDPEGSSLSRHSTLRAAPIRSSTTPRPATAPPPANASETETDPPSFINSSTSSLSSEPIPIRRPSNITSTSSSGNVSESASVDTSANATPAGGNTPTGSLFVNSRERSGTVIGRPSWDRQNQPRRGSGQSSRRPQANNNNGDTDEVETEPENQSENDVEMSTAAAGAGPTGAGGNRAADRERAMMQPEHSTRMAVIVQSDPPDGGMDMNMIVDQGRGLVVGGDTMGVEQGLVNLDMQQTDDLAMGAPPGAPGAVQAVLPPTPATTMTNPPGGATPRQTVDMTPRAGVQPLAVNATPRQTPINATLAQPLFDMRNGVIVPVQQNTTGAGAGAVPVQPSAAHIAMSGGPNLSGLGEDQTIGPYREEDVLLSLQLLAYLSKYPHVRQAFYKTRIPLGPPLVPPPSRRAAMQSSLSKDPSKPPHPQQPPVPPIQRAPNVFSLVERFTFRPSPSELHLPRLPQEIQYWAGVIMRNACRKDEDRGGIRQCANMVCGKWESYPREFAKCRRCRKAKYCGKDCQSKAWADGHRFWCSSRDAEMADAAAAAAAAAAANPNASDSAQAAASQATGDNAAGTTEPLVIQQSTAPGGRRQGRTAPLTLQRPHHHHAHHQHPHAHHQNQAEQQTVGVETVTVEANGAAQPPQAHNIVIRLGPPRSAPRVGAFAPGPTTAPLVPRQRITQHVVAPPPPPPGPAHTQLPPPPPSASTTTTITDPNAMDVDVVRRSSSPGQIALSFYENTHRRRAGTVPAGTGADDHGDVDRTGFNGERELMGLTGEQRERLPGMVIPPVLPGEPAPTGNMALAGVAAAVERFRAEAAERRAALTAQRHRMLQHQHLQQQVHVRGAEVDEEDVEMGGQ